MSQEIEFKNIVAQYKMCIRDSSNTLTNRSCERILIS